jgi:hypothetical protein
MKSDRRDYILSLIKYIDSGHLVMHPRLMADELNQALKVDAQPDKDVTRHLLVLGHSRFIKTWIDKHGVDVIRNGADCPLQTLSPGFGVNQYLKSLRLIEKQIISEPDAAARRLLVSARMVDGPEIIEKSARLLGIPRHDIIGALGHCTTWGPDAPKVSAWTAALIENEFDEKDPAWREVIGCAVRQTQPALMAAFVKLGVNIRPRLKESSVWGSAQWMERLNTKLSSTHGRMALMQQLPSILDCLMLQSSESVRLLSASPEATLAD